jgi:hypothetical protein
MIPLPAPHLTRTLIAWAALAVPALLAGCNTGSEPAAPARTFYGIAANSCGPTDAPVVNLRMDTLPYSGCSDTSHHSRYYLYSQASDVDSLKAGTVITGGLMTLCAVPKGAAAKSACGESTEYRLEVERVSAEKLEGKFLIREISAGHDTTRTEGQTVLFKCRARPACG